MDEETWGLIWIFIPILLTFGPFLFSWIFGNWHQKNKQKQLVKREATFGNDPLSTLRNPTGDVKQSTLLVSNITMSVSWWQGMIGGIHSIFGGTITTWDNVLAWGRQEAMQRLRENCRNSGFDEIINLRLETAEIAGSKGKTKALEIVAYGTAVKY